MTAQNGWLSAHPFLPRYIAVASSFLLRIGNQPVPVAQRVLEVRPLLCDDDQDQTAQIALVLTADSPKTMAKTPAHGSARAPRAQFAELRLGSAWRPGALPTRCIPGPGPRCHVPAAPGSAAWPSDDPPILSTMFGERSDRCSAERTGEDCCDSKSVVSVDFCGKISNSADCEIGRPGARADRWPLTAPPVGSRSDESPAGLQETFHDCTTTREPGGFA